MSVCVYLCYVNVHMSVCQMLVTQLMYPFNVVYNVMAVNNSGSVTYLYYMHNVYRATQSTRYLL